MVIWSTVFGKSLAEMIPDFTAFALFTGKTNLETGKKLNVHIYLLQKVILKFHLF